MTSIFICDDQPHYITALKTFFKLQNNIQIVGEALNGKEALELLLTTSAEICIIDLSMPKMDGIALIQNLNEKKVKIKKIVLSQNSGKEWLDRLISNEIDAFILKTDEKEHLLNAVETVADGEKYFSPAVASIFYRLLSSNTSPIQQSMSDLSQRETEVAICTSKGFTVKEIALQLGCSENTIKTHKANLMRKIEARNSAEVTAWVIKNLRQ